MSIRKDMANPLNIFGPVEFWSGFFIAFFDDEAANHAKDKRAVSSDMVAARIATVLCQLGLWRWTRRRDRRLVSGLANSYTVNCSQT